MWRSLCILPLMLTASACSWVAPVSPVDVTTAVSASGTQTVSVAPLTQMALSADGTMLVAAGETGVALFTTESVLERVWQLSIQGIKDIAISDNAEQIIAVEESGYVFFIESETGTISNAFQINLSSIPTSVALAPGVPQLAIGLWGGRVLVSDTSGDTSNYLWDEYQEAPEVGSSGTVLLDWSSDGKYIAAGGWTTDVFMIDVDTGKSVQQLTPGFGSEHKVAALSLSPDDKYIAVSYGYGYIAVWDLQQGALVKQWREGSDQTFISLQWDQNALFLAGTSNEGTVMVWDASSFQSHLEIHPLQNEVVI